MKNMTLPIMALLGMVVFNAPTQFAKAQDLDNPYGDGDYNDMPMGDDQDDDDDDDEDDMEDDEEYMIDEAEENQDQDEDQNDSQNGDDVQVDEEDSDSDDDEENEDGVEENEEYNPEDGVEVDEEQIEEIADEYADVVVEDGKEVIDYAAEMELMREQEEAYEEMIEEADEKIDELDDASFDADEIAFEEQYDTPQDQVQGYEVAQPGDIPESEMAYLDPVDEDGAPIPMEELDIDELEEIAHIFQIPIDDPYLEEEDDVNEQGEIETKMYVEGLAELAEQVGEEEAEEVIADNLVEELTEEEEAEKEEMLEEPTGVANDTVVKMMLAAGAFMMFMLAVFIMTCRASAQEKQPEIDMESGRRYQGGTQMNQMR